MASIREADFIEKFIPTVTGVLEKIEKIIFTASLPGTRAAGALAIVRDRMIRRVGSLAGLARPDICIMGGGFGGLHTALRLASSNWDGMATPRIKLIDRKDRFVFSPMLYELTTGKAACWEVAPMFEEVMPV